MNKSGRTFRRVASLLAMAAALAVAGLMAGPAMAQSDEVAPTITSVAITSNPGDDNTYGAGDHIDVTVTFSEEVYIRGAGSVQLGLDIGGVSKLATFTNNSTSIYHSTVILRYTVAVGDVDTEGVSITANSFRQRTEPDKKEDNPIQDRAGNQADLSHAALPDDPNHMVNAPGGL